MGGPGNCPRYTLRRSSRIGRPPQVQGKSGLFESALDEPTWLVWLGEYGLSVEIQDRQIDDADVPVHYSAGGGVGLVWNILCSRVGHEPAGAALVLVLGTIWAKHFGPL